MDAELGAGWAEGVHPEDFQGCMDTYLSAFVARRPFRMEYRLRRADGEYRWLLDQGVPRFAPGGAFMGYIGSCVDVTELREATEAQRRATRELEVLVREIHHRVKNNLQVITSLLNLQMRLLQDPRAIELFQETRSRIRSIALLHERLYRSEGVARIGLREYFGSVVAGLRTAFGASAPRAEVRLFATETVVSIDTALPCGLIVNELVTNSFKYAFRPGPAEPRIDVRVDPSPDGGLLLAVTDNGVGLPADLDPEHPKTLGLQLVRSLSRQLGGELHLSTAGGTQWTLTIPPHKDAPGDAN
jgi:two-component system response regulator